MNTYDKLIIDIDSISVLDKLKLRYPNLSEQEMELAVKNDLKNYNSMFQMISEFKMEIDEFFIHMSGVFPDLMNKRVVQKRIKKNLELRKNES